jgi:DNA-binding PadR family transcriptional regulator
VDLTAAELTLLGLLVESPRHGYDLERVIEQRGIRQWTDIGFSSIYYLLGKLERRGLVAAVGAATGPTSRRVHAATDEGRAALVRVALDLVATPQPPRHPLLVALAQLPSLPGDELDAALRARRDLLDAQIGGVEAARVAQHAHGTLPEPAREVFSLALHLMSAERAWLADRIRATEEPSDDESEDDDA